MFFTRTLSSAAIAVFGYAGVATAAPMTETVIYNFGGYPGDAFNPTGGLASADGMLFGGSQYGGFGAAGTVFAASPDGTEAVIHRLHGKGVTPLYPTGIAVAGGVLYGTVAVDGGVYGKGSVFRILRDGTEQTIYSFGGYQGDATYPEAAPIDVNGTLYGTSEFGGAHGKGAVYKIAPDGTESVLYSFKGAPDAYYPGAVVLTELNGILYGTGAGGGTFDDGAVFSLTLSGTEAVVYSLGGNPNDGYAPTSGLVALNGTLYGTTAYSISELGETVYSVTPSGTEKILYSFPYNGNAYPDSSTALVVADGTLFGTTEYGGLSNEGTVFAVTPAGEETQLYSFKGSTDGSLPDSALVRMGSKLYGETAVGGVNGDGTLFAISR